MNSSLYMWDAHIFSFKKLKKYFQVYIFLCKMMIEFIWDIRKCGFLLARDITRWLQLESLLCWWPLNKSQKICPSWWCFMYISKTSLSCLGHRSNFCGSVYLKKQDRTTCFFFFFLSPFFVLFWYFLWKILNFQEHNLLLLQEWFCLNIFEMALQNGLL